MNLGKGFVSAIEFQAELNKPKDYPPSLNRWVVEYSSILLVYYFFLFYLVEVKERVFFFGYYGCYFGL